MYNPCNFSRFLELELLVDTEGTYTWIQHCKPENLGIRPISRRIFRTIEGKVTECEVGVKCLGERATTKQLRELKLF
ncbi:MAG: hypothetical protein DRJ40_02490 [Thermoprotei archaeon]|nr:MAG: hypothetical protein DRJ40_02490 [Thermoprotei archaeon]